MKQYVVKNQKGGYASLSSLRDKLKQDRMQRDATNKPQMISANQFSRNFLTGNLVTKADAEGGMPGTPVIDNREPSSIHVPYKKSVREKIIDGLNMVDRNGDNMVAGIATEPLKAVARVLRPDKYFTGVQSDSNIGEGALRLGMDAANVVPAMQEVNWLRKGARGAVSLADSQLSRVGRELETVARRGRVAGLSEDQIAANQLDKVGITANQRKGYMPGISDLLQKRVRPFGYPQDLGELVTRVKEGNSLNQIEKDIARGMDNKDGIFNADLQRNDAWRTYLGMPQKNNTFRYGENVSENFPRKASEDVYSLNHDNTKHFINSNSAGYEFGGVGGDMGVMGNYNVAKHPNGLEYWDRWDLDPQIDVPFTKAREYPMIGDDELSGGFRRPKITIPVSKFIGKPFISNGVVPETYGPSSRLPESSLMNHPTIKQVAQQVSDPAGKAALGGFATSGLKLKDWLAQQPK